jgi:hypothetical protein
VLPGDGFLVVIGDGRSFVDLAEPVHRAGGEEERAGELRLAGPGMTGQGDVTDGGGIEDTHCCRAPCDVRTCGVRCDDE